MREKRDVGGGREPVLRYGDAYLASSLKVGEEATLRVGLTPRPGLSDIVAMKAIPQTELQVEVSLSGPRTQLLSAPSQPLYVPVRGEARPIYFHLRADEPGELEAAVTFTYRERILAEAHLRSQVVALGPDAWAPEGSAYAQMAQTVFVSERAARPPEGQVLFGQTPPDITLSIVEEPPGYRFVVYTVDPGLAPASEVSPESWTVHLVRSGQEIMEAVWEQVRDGSGHGLERLGCALYDEMFPPGFKEWYRDRVHPAASRRRLTLALVCAEPLKPWEMARPFWTEPDGRLVEADFLCRQFVTSRWLPDTPPPPDAVPVTRITVIIRPTKTFAEYDERRYLVEMQDRLRGLEVGVAYDSGAVSEKLGQGEASVVHFLTPPGELAEDDGQELAGFRQTRPLVFVNAHTRDPDRLQLTGLGRWAQRFIRAGCSAFVGPLWEVDDALAFQFAVEFYEALWAGRPLAEALDQARKRIRDMAPADPAWLAYTLYGHPFAKVYVPQPGEGYVIAHMRDLPPGTSLDVGRPYELEVMVRPEAPGSYRGQLADTRKRGRGPTLEVTVTGPGFRVEPLRAFLPIGEEEPQPIRFSVVPLEAGRHSLVVQYWARSHYAGALDVPLDVRGGGER